jgi:hypothetical protein
MTSAYLIVADRKYQRLSPPARRTIAALERFRDAGEAVWEINTHACSKLADLTTVRQIEALRELADAGVIALAWTDPCGCGALVARPADAAELARRAANFHAACTDEARAAGAREECAA